MEYKQGIKLNNPASCRRLLNRCVNQLLNNEIKTDQARCIGYLTSLILKSIETEELEKRIEDLEKVVKQ